MCLKQNAINVVVAVLLVVLMVLTATLGLVAAKQQELNTIFAEQTENNRLSGHPFDLVFATVNEGVAEGAQKYEEMKTGIIPCDINILQVGLVRRITEVKINSLMGTPVKSKVVLRE